MNATVYRVCKSVTAMVRGSDFPVPDEEEEAYKFHSSDMIQKST